jgi:tripartite-type tricarboxylate transporter receptor subunit TctC
MKRHSLLVILAGGFLAAVAGASSAVAQDAYPSRRVTVVVPSPAGSTTDSLARLVADQLQRKWGQTVIVENNGRGLNFGAEQVSRAPADGYTLLVTAPMPLTFANLLYRDINYRASDFVPVSLLAKIPNVLAVRKNLPAKDVKELVAYAKANPGKVTYASSAAGSTAHLSGAQLEVRGGIKMTHVPYRGSAPAINDLLGGHVDLFFDTLSTSVPLWRGGKINILAVASPERVDAVKELPTIAESGFPGFRSITWFAMAAPPKTPAAIAAKINRDIVEILKSPEIEKRLQELRLDPMVGSPADAAKFFADETELWGGVIKEANVTAH